MPLQDEAMLGAKTERLPGLLEGVRNTFSGSLDREEGLLARLETAIDEMSGCEPPRIGETEAAPGPDTPCSGFIGELYGKQYQHAGLNERLEELIERLQRLV